MTSTPSESNNNEERPPPDPDPTVHLIPGQSQHNADGFNLADIGAALMNMQRSMQASQLANEARQQASEARHTEQIRLLRLCLM